MLERTKKPPTDPVVLSFAVPPDLVATVMQNMHGLGLREENEGIPWREAFEVKDEELPAICLRGARYRETLTQKQLAEKTGIPIPHISAMENNKRAIGKKNARLLAQALNIDPRRLLSV